MATKTEINRGLERIARGDTLDASDRDLCASVMLASFGKFGDQIAPNAPSTGAALNGVAVVRQKCALSTEDAIEPTWIAARLVGVARDEAIIVDSLAAATMVMGAGGKPCRQSPEAVGYILTNPADLAGARIATGTRLAVVRKAGDPNRADRLAEAGRIATVNVGTTHVVDLYEGGADPTGLEVMIDKINRESGNALDRVADRHPGVRRRPKGSAQAAHPIAHDLPQRSETDQVNDIYDGYRPEVAFTPLAKAHPTPLIQSKTLAGAIPMAPTYRPVLHETVLTSGAVSDCQFEAIVMAGQSHTRHLPFDEAVGGEPRMGFYLADGTGAGKTNTCMGIILDNWNQGRRRHVVVGEKKRHMAGFVKAMQMLGMNPDNMIALDDYRPGAPLVRRDGILFVTYALLRQCDESNRFQRVQQIVDWAGPGFEGVIVFDESQNMRNLALNNDGQWAASAALQALAGRQLQDTLRDARVVYSSATGLTLLENVGYMARLGLWGAATPYKTSEDFFDIMNQSGLSGLEAISSHIKANGQMVCRQLSLSGVIYEELVHAMGPDDIALYDAYCRTLFEVTQTAAYCVGNAIRRSPGDVARPDEWRSIRVEANGQPLAAMFAGMSKRLIDTLIVSIKCQSLIADMEKANARGESCVIQIQNTFEAELNRMLAKGDGIDSDELQATADLIRFVQSLPEVAITSRSEVILDAKKQPRQIAENAAAKANLIAKIRSLPAFVRPLEALFSHFGEARLAEITGRSHRVVPAHPMGRSTDPTCDILLQERTDADVRADHKAFMADQKRNLIFSNEAGGTGMDYHASLFVRNQRLRRHYVLQLGYRADQAVQGPGRSHRSNQKQPPVIVYVALDIPAERIYMSGVVSHMASLGALSQGHRGASTNGMFSALDTYRSSHAVNGWETFASKLRHGQYDDLTLKDLAVVGSLEKGGSTRELLPMMQFLKRATALPVEIQKRTFEKLDFEIQNHIMSLISSGKYDGGPEMLRDPVTVLDEAVIYTHPNTGARVKVTQVECDVTASLTPYDSAISIAAMLAPAGEEPSVWFNEASAEVWIEYGTQLATNGFEMVHVIRPDYQTVAPKFTLRGRRIEQITDTAKTEMLWSALTNRLAQQRQRYRTIISGALPLVWPLLQRSQYNRRLIVARTADDSRILGFTTDENEVEALRIRLEESHISQPALIARVYDEFRAGRTIYLKNGMIITPQIVGVATRQTLNMKDADTVKFRQNAAALSIDVHSFGGIEHFVFSNDSDRQAKTLASLIAIYGYKESADMPDWATIS